LTGVSFALATVWFVYPRLESGFAEVRAVLAARSLQIERGAEGISCGKGAGE